ncbi:DDB1- and CUL4-associated factor 5 [Boothiomyces sp. JEL0838]|nr:DDB1- and CUL4-associated factor 5 [Boothiomyces sp. JEL0838]
MKRKWHSKAIKDHSGCVNALSYKNGLLATGGDDLDVLVYRMHDLENELVFKGTGHLSNIFSIEFSNDYMLSCGNDGLVIIYNIETGKSVKKQAHLDACLKLSCKDSIYLTAGQDYTIKLWDLRARKALHMITKPGHQKLKIGRRQNSVQFNPVNQNLFISSDDKGGVYLYDLRNLEQSFKYNTRIHTNTKLSNPSDVTCAVWNEYGTQIGTNVQKFYPLIFNVNDPQPILMCYDDNFNSLCTIKTGCFFSDYFFMGSDDYKCYGFKLSKPKESEFMVNGQQVPIVKPTTVLSGHYSIVNSCMNVNDMYIATAGVERVVRIFAPFDTRETYELDDDEFTIRYFKLMIDGELEGLDDCRWQKLSLDESDSDSYITIDEDL